jgi:hypothetical protein
VAEESVGPHVLAHILAMIRRQDDQRVSIEVVLFEIFEENPEVVVEVGDLCVVFVQVVVESRDARNVGANVDLMIAGEVLRP